jgi:23S rRNA (guanosine2251-2'-O)-methyltransferase
MRTRIVYGIHAVGHLLSRRSERVDHVYIQSDIGARRLGRINEYLEKSDVVVERVDGAALAKLTGTDKHQGVVASVRVMDPLDESEARLFLEKLENPLVLLLDGVQDPRNFGSILRTADAAGVDLVVTGRNRNVSFTPAVSKVAAGAAEIQPVAEVANLVRFMGVLKELGIWIIGTAEGGGQSLFDTDLTGPAALVLGAEGQGLRRLSQQRCDYLVHLPMHGSVESLNVGVAAGICLYEALRQRRLAPDQALR